MEKNELTAEESFKIISKAISNFKMNYKESSKIFLLWGWVLTLASISNFVILKILFSQGLHSSSGFYSLGNWLLFFIIGFTIFYFIDRKMHKVKKVYTIIDGYFKNLWTVSAASFFIATAICIKLEINPPPIMLLIAGIATTTSGLLIKFKPLTIGGISFFLFSIAATFITNEYIALIVGAAIICGYLIPGYYLKSAEE